MLEGASKRVSERVEIAIRYTLPACFWWQEVDKGRGLYLCTGATLVVQGAGCK